MSFKECPNRTLKKVQHKDKDFSWNRNKFEGDFIKKIIDRTELTVDELTATVEQSLKTIELPPKSKAVCLYFMTSNFIILLNTEKNQIVTVRDGTWNKLPNGCCTTQVANKDAIKMSDAEVSYLNNQEHSSLMSIKTLI